MKADRHILVLFLFAFVLGLLLGILIGSGAIRAQAVEARHATWVLTPEGKSEFQWLPKPPMIFDTPQTTQPEIVE